MKAAVLRGKNDVRIEDMPVPRPGPGEILVRMAACGLCGTDLGKIREGNVPLPAVLGHEVAGDVEDAAAYAGKFGRGDRVVVFHHMPCFVCRYCRRGSHSQCGEFKEQRIHPGGFAEYLTVSRGSAEKAVLRIPDNISYEEASFTETLACCLRAYRRCGIRAGDTVMVVGMGPVGLLHLQLAPLFGAAKTIAADRLDSRLSAAGKLGADLLINAGRDDAVEAVMDFTGLFGADAVIVAAYGAEAFQESFRYVSKGGRVLVFAGWDPGAALKLDPQAVYQEEVSVVGSYSSTPAEQVEALGLIGSGRIKVGDLITHRFRLSEFNKAVSAALHREDSLKIVLRP